MTIWRQWRGLAETERADDYVEHLRRDTFPQLEHIPGFIDATILRRVVARGVEFLIVTRWQSLDAIRRFAGVRSGQRGFDVGGLGAFGGFAGGVGLHDHEKFLHWKYGHIVVTRTNGPDPL